MQKSLIFCLLIVFIVSISCKKNETADVILQKTIDSIDTLETVYYKQDMTRTNPRNINETIFRYREMYFQRLKSDSIVGVKGHWYFYNNDKTKVNYEDIYDGNRLIRKNNIDSIAVVFNLIKYPKFKEKHFWSHNTPFAIQYEIKHALNNREHYRIERLNDTIFRNANCYVISIVLENKQTMPGFATKLEKSEGSIFKTTLFIYKQNLYPVKMLTESYSLDNLENIYIVEQIYYDLKFNINLNERVRFNTLNDVLAGFKITERKP